MYRPTHHIRTALESMNNSTSLKHHLEKMRRGIEKRFIWTILFGNLENIDHFLNLNF